MNINRIFHIHIQETLLYMIFILAKVQKLKFYVTTDHCNLEFDENIGF